MTYKSALQKGSKSSSYLSSSLHQISGLAGSQGAGLRSLLGLLWFGKGFMSSHDLGPRLQVFVLCSCGADVGFWQTSSGS